MIKDLHSHFFACTHPGYLSSGYQKLCGPCRSADGGQGLRDNYYNKGYTFESCKNKCNAQSTCVAFEYGEREGYTGCEIHKKGTVMSTGIPHRDNANCWFKP